MNAENQKPRKSDRIIGSAIAVHRRLGPGFLESIYEKALRVELARRGVSSVGQVAVPIRYLDVDVGTHVLDLLVAASTLSF